MSDKLHVMAAQIIELMRAGKIDVEAGQNALSSIETQMKHEQMMKVRPVLTVHNDAKDAFEYGAGKYGEVAGQARGRTKPTPWDKLCMRMDWEQIGASHKRKMQLFSDGGYVFVMGVVNGEPFTLKDEEHIFPSDQVVTQLRLLYNGE